MEASILNPISYRSYFDKGISFEKYFQSMGAGVESGVESEYSEYIPMNFQRTKRVGKTLQLLDEMKEAMKNIPHQINWLVISEHWCGDASQTMPLIHAIAEASSGKIELRIVYRDENPELMDAHLTNGGRAIPKLIQMNGNYEVTGEWGPRPKEAQALVKQLKSDPTTAPTYAEVLHKWYADDKTVSTQKELINLLKSC